MAAEAKTPGRRCFVAGAIGPLTRTLSMSPDVNRPDYRAVTWAQVTAAYEEQGAKLGDVSLYTAGFFSDLLRDRVVGPDYYIQMGSTAYGAIAQLSGGSSAFASVYWELHQKFRTVVEVLEEIAARGMAASGPGGRVKVLESFTRSGSERLGQGLLEAGVMPKGPVN